MGVLREQGESTGVEQLVESAYENYGLPRDQVVELVDTSFAAAEDIARMFA